MEKLLQKDVNWIKKNWEKIPDKYKEDLKPNKYGLIEGISKEEHFVVLLLDRQKPSVEASYDFDEERIGITRTGKVIWGFDSGCSCPCPWEDRFPECYNTSKTWKEFKVELKVKEHEKFDDNWSEEAKAKIEKIKKSLRS